MIRPIRHALPSFIRRLGNSAIASGISTEQFSPSFVKQSFKESLQRLQTDYVDLLFLHEVTPDDLSDALLSLLDRLRCQGRTLALGVASAYSHVATIAKMHGTFFDVFQYSWSLLDQDRPKPEGADFVITHQALIRAYAPILQWLAADPNIHARLTQAIGMELTRETLGDLLLGGALFHNPGGLVLAASHRSARIMQFGHVLSDTQLQSAGGRLIDAIAAEPNTPAPTGR
jgi:diketogulonate reductase-like aldo/keto reductase